MNQILYTGPKLQQDLWLILTRWRLFRFAFATDIVKMFRQIEIDYDDSFYQLILWRKSITDAIKIYRLRTVTYGTASAPYLANRVLLQLAKDENLKFPLGASILEKNT